MPPIETAIFVTGAGGFIGSSVVEALAGGGATVCAHLGPRGMPVNPAPAAARTAFADILDVDALTDLAQGCRVAVHLAGPASVRDSFQATAEYVRVHVSGTAAFLEACRRTGIRRVVYVSSAEVYGRPVMNPVAEASRLEPRSPYAAAKAAAEHLIGACTFSNGLRATILRPFSIYGPRLSLHSIVGKVVRAAYAGEPIVVRDLRPVRDYCYVGDLARAVALACEADVPGVLNIGSGTGVSVLELVQTVLAVGGFRGEVSALPGPERPPAADIDCLVANNRRAREVLGWMPEVTLETGLRCTIRWLQSIIS